MTWLKQEINYKKEPCFFFVVVGGVEDLYFKWICKLHFSSVNQIVSLKNLIMGFFLSVYFTCYGFRNEIKNSINNICWFGQTQTAPVFIIMQLFISFYLQERINVIFNFNNNNNQPWTICQLTSKLDSYLSSYECSQC